METVNNDIVRAMPDEIVINSIADKIISNEKFCEKMYDKLLNSGELSVHLIKIRKTSQSASGT
jgi:ribosomal protein L15